MATTTSLGPEPRENARDSQASRRDTFQQAPAPRVSELPGIAHRSENHPALILIPFPRSHVFDEVLARNCISPY